MWNCLSRLGFVPGRVLVQFAVSSNPADALDAFFSYDSERAKSRRHNDAKGGLP
jgi:hypothetical protein